MKNNSLKLSTVILLFTFIRASCQKQKDKINYDPDNIIGKWEWLYSVGGDFTASYSYPQKGQIRTMEFGENGILLFKDNGKTYSETNFSISDDTLRYFENNKVEHIYLFEINRDTLKLRSPYLLGNFSFFKRRK